MKTSFTVLALWLVTSVAGAPRTGFAAPADSPLIREYRSWLDEGRTPARLVDLVRAQSPGWTHIDHLRQQPEKLRAGARVLFTDRGRTVMIVLVGTDPLMRSGFRMIAAHLDTPTPRLDLSSLRAAKTAPLTARAHRHGSIRWHHWQHVPLALVGRVAVSGEREVAVTLGLDDSDEFAFYATAFERRSRALTIHMASIAAKGTKSKKPSKERKPTPRNTAGVSPDRPAPETKNIDSKRDADWLVRELHRRYQLTRSDLATAELYLVPRERARDVGLDRALIGAHGQDDRANSYLAWRALRELSQPPPHTVVAWLVDREEVGSYHPAGATSQFLEAVLAYLLRAQGQKATEANLARLLGRSAAISADTPALLNPNWPEVHEAKHAPIIGHGAVVFAHTGGEGKDGGTQAHGALVRAVDATFARAGAPLQYGLLGRVDAGGGGTIAKYLANRGIDVVDVGVAGISLHSPMELFAKADLESAFSGFKAWLAGQ